MDDRWEELVRERAYRIWERAGSPEGHAEQFWLMAEEELLAEGYSRPGAAPRPSRLTPKSRRGLPNLNPLDKSIGTLHSA